METELWKKLPYPQLENYYFISSFGRVKSIHIYCSKTTKILKPYENKKSGYWYIGCQYKNKRRNFILHRLVALAFVHNQNPVKFNIVDHIDFNKANNKASNLTWCNQLMNVKRTVENGRNTPVRGERSGMTTLTNEDVFEIRKMKSTGQYLHREIAKKFNISTCSVTLIINRQRWSHI